MSFDKSTRQGFPAEKMFPAVARTGFLGTAAQKVWENPSNIPAPGRLIITNTSASARTFTLWVVDDGGSPGNADLIGKAIDLDPDETMMYPEGDLWIPELGELWAAASVADSVTVYAMFHYYV